MSWKMLVDLESIFFSASMTSVQISDRVFSKQLEDKLCPDAVWISFYADEFSYTYDLNYHIHQPAKTCKVTFAPLKMDKVFFIQIQSCFLFYYLLKKSMNLFETVIILLSKQGDNNRFRVGWLCNRNIDRIFNKYKDIDEALSTVQGLIGPPRHMGLFSNSQKFFQALLW